MRLSALFFISFGLIIILGTFSILFESLTLIFYISVVSFSIIIILDLRRFKNINSFELKLQINQDPILESTCIFNISGNIISNSFNQIFFISPQSSRVKFKNTLCLLSLNKSLLDQNIEAVAIKLGFEEFKNLNLFIISPFKFWNSQIHIEIEPCRFRVLSKSKLISDHELKKIISKNRLLHQGNRIQIRSHSPDQFLSIRKFSFPDPIKFIDHKKSARYQQLMTREYDTFFSNHLIIGLDLGRALSGSIYPSDKIDHYLGMILQLLKVSIGFQDRVSFFAFSNHIHMCVKNARNINVFDSIYRGDQKLTPKLVESNYEIIPSMISKLAGQRSIVLLLSDFTKPSIQESYLKIIPRTN